MIERIARAMSALALAAALAACQNAAGPPGNYGTVSGKVASTSGQPIAGVTVQVDSGPSGTTGSDGMYTIGTVPVTDALSPDIVVVTNVPSGYAVPPPQNNIQVQAGHTTVVNFTLNPI